MPDQKHRKTREEHEGCHQHDATIVDVAPCHVGAQQKHARADQCNRGVVVWVSDATIFHAHRKKGKQEARKQTNSVTRDLTGDKVDRHNRKRAEHTRRPSSDAFEASLVFGENSRCPAHNEVEQRRPRDIDTARKVQIRIAEQEFGKVRERIKCAAHVIRRIGGSEHHAFVGEDMLETQAANEEREGHYPEHCKCVSKVLAADGDVAASGRHDGPQTFRPSPPRRRGSARSTPMVVINVESFGPLGLSRIRS